MPESYTNQGPAADTYLVDELHFCNSQKLSTTSYLREYQSRGMTINTIRIPVEKLAEELSCRDLAYTGSELRDAIGRIQQRHVGIRFAPEDSNTVLIRSRTSWVQ